ncbi:polysaccharide deacetylase family protein [Streptomyces sp. NBC_01264]|uniref:polysaccharide deacetylase family protein n=1 Tax=Streptomyces sp. NBC_01264 TaxID=2903804 RepID=UPI0022585331|nr:polysaccharide deacetylase family protein [Streptomyces sp. NBC_01264]MCX4775610.1 polysaccharide deacetylase family protein [Streptomyces sp. NBC_01264]
MGITRSSVRRLRAGSAIAAATLAVLAAGGAPALAAPNGPAGSADSAGAAGSSDRSAEGSSAARSSAASAYGPARVPVGISRLAAGPGHAIAITIDDGPDPRWTPEVLKVLRENHVKATFCMIGTSAQQHPDLVRAVAAEGHRLCDHSVDHDVTMDHKPVAYQQQQILDGKAMIEEAGPGVAVRYYRAPGGAFTPDSRAIAAANGMRPLGWSVDPKDWSRPGLPAIVATVEGQLPARPTVLFHDGGGDRSETVAALKEYLPWLKARGYTFTFPNLTTP